MKELQWKAIMYGVAAFIAAWLFLWYLYSTFIFNDDGRFNSELHFLIFSAIAFVFSGYITAHSVKNNLILHSAAAGIAVSLILIISWLFLDSFNHNTLYSFIMTPIYITALSSFGGIITKFQRSTL